jgi:preprotein translocase subunit SecG
MMTAPDRDWMVTVTMVVVSCVALCCAVLVQRLVAQNGAPK